MLFKSKKLRYIFLASLVLAVTVPLLNNYVIYPRHRHNLIMHTEDNAVRVARHIARHVTDQKENFDKDFIKQWGKENGKYVIKDFNLMKITIFAPSGEIIHSSSSENIGKVNLNSNFHEIVAKGEVVTKVIEKENKTPEAKVIKSDVTETYVPITRGAELLGVFEICYDITQHLNDLRKRFSTLLIYLIFFIFLSLIFTVLIRLDRQMLKQKTTTELLETFCCWNKRSKPYSLKRLKVPRGNGK